VIKYRIAQGLAGVLCVALVGILAGAAYGDGRGWPGVALLFGFFAFVGAVIWITATLSEGKP
jgi:hypothetical protein